MPIVSFLIFFPFLMAFILFFMKKASRLRSATVIFGSIMVIAAVIYMAVIVLGRGGGEMTFLTETVVQDRVIMAGEIFLMLLVFSQAIRFKKWYIILLSAAGTIPVIWLDLSGKAEGIAGSHIRIDNLTMIMCLVVGIVGGLICMYADGYIRDYHVHHKEFKDRSNYFLAMLFVFLGAMFGLITSNNLSWIYFFWEITSVCSFLLIGYSQAPEAVTNSFRALWMNLLGGCGFMLAILYCTLKLNIVTLSALTASNVDSAYVVVPVALLAFAALTKSAQMPFSRWLLGAMVAPTPTSALLHSATMVKAGVYLLIRLGPKMSGTTTGVMVTAIGGFTFFAASLLAISVSDGKKVLAYSTISNLGLITACAGVGLPEAIWAAIMLLIFHAVSKSLMFLSVGAVENCTGSRDIEDMHGLIIKLPKLAFVMTVGICGMFLAPFGMLVAKWAALKAFVDSDAVWLTLFLVFGSASTLFYWAKWLGKIFAYIHQSETYPDTVHKSEWVAIYPLTGLVIALCFMFPLISKYTVIPLLGSMFGQVISSVIDSSDIKVMFMMLFMIGILPLLMGILAKTRNDKMTMSYMSGCNAGDDRHYIDSFGNVRPLYLSNWYMQEIFGEKKILVPSLAIAAAFLVILMIVTVGGAL